MKTISQYCVVSLRKLLFFFTFTFAGTIAFAQAPTSLQYPTPNVFIANVTSVYLAPTLSGSTTGLSYGISPVLPGGLSFNTSTGVISGVPTVASNATSYTITATNASGSTNTSISITVTNTYFDNARDSIFFNTTDTVKKIGDGTHVGDVILYKNVRTIGGQAIDCIVKTRSFTAGTTFTNYDQPLVTDGSTFNSNNPRFFSPQVGFPTGGGNVIFDFQFIAGGTYNNGTGTGTNVTLQNVQLNTYDIDGNGAAGSNQFNEFAGFDTSEVASATSLKTPVFDTNNVLTKYESNISTNSLIVTADPTRIRLTYKNMSSFSIQVGGGAGGAAYFFLDFSTGPAFSTAVKTTPPTVDLNTSVAGTENGASGCASSIPFTVVSQTNVASGTTLNKLIISYTNNAANLPDGTGEQLKINGFTAGTGSFPLNFSTGSITSVTVGGVAYTVKKSASGTKDTITFTNGSSTFTLANAETLLDALQYMDTVSNPTAGDRTFKVNITNSLFISPDAVFTASIKCVSIGGNIYHDANGLTDNTVNGNGPMGQFAGGSVYAVLTDAVTNNVLSTVPVTAGGAYTFGRTDPGNYNIFISNTATPGSSITSPTYPTGNYGSIGENLGSGAGNDKLIDGKLSILLGTIAASSTNFGIEIPPVAADSTIANRPNPGGFNYFTIPAGAFKVSDADGTVDSLIITAFPTGANYLKAGSIIYTNGGTCPPQSSCTAWPGTLRLPYSAAGTLSIDPASDLNTSVAISYTVLDNAHVSSTTIGTLTIMFTTPTVPFTVSGNVWDDGNGNGIKESGEAYSVAADAGKTLYALLVQTTNTYSGAATIFTSAPVITADTGYIFSNVPGGNNYEVRIATLAAAPVSGSALTTITQSLATGYYDVSTTDTGVIVTGLSTVAPVITLGNITSNKAQVSFGIDQIPAGADYASSRLLSVNGTNTIPVPSAAFTGTDIEDGTYTSGLSGKSVTISPAVNGNLYYNGVLITTTTNYPSFNPSLLVIDPTGATPLAASSDTAMFTYIVKDAAGQPSLAKTITLYFVPGVSITGNVYDDSNGLTDNMVNGTGTNGGGLNAILISVSTGNVITSATIAADGSYTLTADTGSYNVEITTNTAIIGSTAPAVALPSGYVSTGEHLGSGTGSDGTVNGILPLGAIAASTANANLGIDQLPTATAATGSLVNPGGTATIQVPTLTGFDPEQGAFPGTGNADTVIINTIPVSGTLYYNGTPVTAGDTIKNYNPTLLTFDPSSGSGSSAFTFSEVDAALKTSAPASVTMTFSPVSITGNVYDDANGLTDNTVNGTGTNGGGLNAVLVDAGTGKVAAATTVAGDGSYTLTADAGSYNVEITTNTPTIGSTAPAVTLPSGYVSTGEHLGSGTGSDGTVNGILPLGAIAASTANANLGIDQLPTTDAKVYNIITPPINTIIILSGTGTNPGPLSGNDPEDGALGATNTVVITSVPTNAELYYNGVLLTDNTVINNYDTSLLQIKLTSMGSVSTNFQYVFKDASANQSAAPATYTILWLRPLPVVLVSFNALKVNNESVLEWTTSSELNTHSFIIEHSTDNGRSWQAIGMVNAVQNSNVAQNYSYTDVDPANGINLYRLKITDRSGSYKYSDVKQIRIERSPVVSVYPNPATSGKPIQLKLSGLQPGKYQLNIVSATGQLLHAGSINIIDGNTITSLVSTSNLPKGANTIVVEGNGFTISKKIIIL